MGFEGRVLNDSPGDCQTSPPLRPGVPENARSEFLGWMKAGESLAACQKMHRLCRCIFCCIGKNKSGIRRAFVRLFSFARKPECLYKTLKIRTLMHLFTKTILIYYAKRRKYFFVADSLDKFTECEYNLYK